MRKKSHCIAGSSRLTHRRVLLRMEVSTTFVPPYPTVPSRVGYCMARLTTAAHSSSDRAFRCKRYQSILRRDEHSDGLAVVRTVEIAEGQCFPYGTRRTRGARRTFPGRTRRTWGASGITGRARTSGGAVATGRSRRSITTRGSRKAGAGSSYSCFPRRGIQPLTTWKTTSWWQPQLSRNLRTPWIGLP